LKTTYRERKLADFVATRNTCFALTSAIEDDFRSLIIALGDAERSGIDLLPPDVRETAIKRRSSDLRTNLTKEDVQDSDLLSYIDFADIAKILESKLAPIFPAHKEWLILSARNLLSLTAARNRVCHTRPLETGDLPSLVDYARNLVSPNNHFPFKDVSHALSRLAAEPGFVLTLQIP
jgi:LuxR family glucitol operon transcriptional activator